MPRKMKKSGQKKTPAHQVPEDILQRLLANAPEEFYIRHLPATFSTHDFPDRLPNICLPWQQCGDVAAKLRSLQNEYRQTHNGIYLLSGLLIAHKNKLYPPIWVLNGLSEAFQNYWNDPSSSLDRYIGLKPGRGQEPAYKASVRRAQHEDIATDMWLLIHRYGISIDEAADLVSLKLDDCPPKKGRWSVRLPATFTQETLSKLYSTKWKRQFALTTGRYNMLSPHYPSDFWRCFLSSFPISELDNGKLRAKFSRP